ncbi:fatty acid desaturase [Rapidithrix thailandica]|uniref:Fatty acid desaturase n=1 Tax=Rapidithrix thailandica TaxID=413964 RepID=A0AAW9S3L4_9BACT
MIPLPTLTDPEYKRPEKYSAFDNYVLSMLRDKRDLPFVYLTLKITFIMVPLGILLYLPFVTGWIWWVISAAYFIVNNLVFKGPFGLMFHCTSHRPLYKSKHTILNQYLTWFICPFFGQTPETYFSHHIGMHHLENNLEEDESSTMMYQRDNFKDYMMYFGKFFFRGLLDLIKYFDIRKLFKFRNKVILGEASFIIFCVLMSVFVDFSATFMVFMLPFLMSRIVMMLGNFGQHAFVDFDDPGNCYKNSTTCINSKYNHKCWNDGYHISHHLKPNMHWTEHPQHLRDHADDYAKNKALVFEKLDFLRIWWYLMHKDYETLADHLVNINGMFASREEAIALMKSRTRKMPARGITATSLRKTQAA